MRRVARAVLLCCLALVTAGCIGIPDDGPIVESQSGVPPGEQLGYYSDPRPPIDGDTPTGIVQGFLDAQAAIPLQTNTAEQFLTETEATTWRHRRIITYAAASPPEGSNNVVVELDGANQIDARGSWLGALPAKQQTLEFTMKRVEGEWRIDDAPDALVVPESWFGQAFRRVSLFYLDPTGEILVPEPVHVPRGDQLATSLVEALLQGPVPRLAQVERSAIPPGLDVDLSVTPDDQGVAEVNLSGDVAMPTEQDAVLMIAQFARTLAQDTSLTGFRINVDGRAVSLPSGQTEFSLAQGSSLDPAGAQATSLLFGLREGRLVSGTPGDLEADTGPMGAEALGVRSVGVELTGSRVAGVSEAGDEVLLTAVGEPDAEVTPVLSGGTDVLPPVWDAAGRLWLLDRAGGSAQVKVFQNGRLRDIDVPGVNGRDVAAFLVSRDGSRLVAVIDRPAGDRIVVSRQRYATGGRALGGTPAQTIAWDDRPRPGVVDLGWSSPTSVAVAHRLTGDLFQVRTLAIDGAPAGLASLAATVPQRPRLLIASPRASDAVLVLARDGLIDVLSGRRLSAADPQLTYLTYVGG